jgi:LCP family protein required for cell wall assembly
MPGHSSSGSSYRAGRPAGSSARPSGRSAPGGQVYGGSSREPGAYTSGREHGSGTYGSGTYGSGTYGSGTYGSGTYGSGAGGYGGRPPRDPRDPYRNSPDRQPRPPRRKTPLWAKLTLAAGAFMMLMSGTTVAGYEFFNNRYAGNVQEENLLGDAAVDPGKELEGPLNMLLLGVEERGAGARSDTVIVLHIPAGHDQAYLISVPRDTYVDVPGYWGMKITEAFYEGYHATGVEDGTKQAVTKGWAAGAQVVASALNSITGLQFDAAAIVNFGGFEKIIDSLGGMRFCFDTAAYSEHYVRYNGEVKDVGTAKRDGTIWQSEQITYEEGCRKVEGWEALDYARQRKTLASGEGDYGRQRHQQQLLKAMMKAAISKDTVTNIGKLDSLIKAAGDALIVDTNGVELADFVFTLKDVNVGDLVSLRTNGGDYQSYQVNGKSFEKLTDESLAMFRAAANDTMADFVLNHPDFINPT